MDTDVAIEWRTSARHPGDQRMGYSGSTTDTALAAVDDTVWRRLNPTLWAGRRNGLPIGTIERHRRFVATDCDGVSYGYFDTLDDSVQALLLPEPDQRLRGRRLHGGWFLHLSALAAGIAVLVGLLAALLWNR